jgi:hypothetical protein
VSNGAISTLTQQWYVVFDGGECYFEATYDPATKEVVRLVFNGLG